MLKKKYVNTTDKSQQIQDLKKYSLTWDVYSISILFTTLILKLQIDIDNYDFMKEYMNILLKTIFSDPISRPPIKTIVEKIESIFRSIKKEEYQSFLNSLQKEETKQEETKQEETKQEDNHELLEEAAEEVLPLPLPIPLPVDV